MRALDITELDAESHAFDELAGQTPDIDHFCSTTQWIIPAYEAFGRGTFSPWIRSGASGYVAMMQGWHERLGTFRQPLEASWCLASPLIGAEPLAMVEELFEECAEEPRASWNLLFLSGLTRNSAVYHGLVGRFSKKFFVGAGPPVTRYRASLEGGAEGFLARRSSKFRANLRRIERRAQEGGVTVERCTQEGGAHWEQLYERILDVEDRSWKGRSRSGIRDSAMLRFYEVMLPRLVARDALRVVFLRRDEEDVAFVFGAVWQGLYRGLQVSFDDDCRDLSPGNMAQVAMIRWLGEEGVQWYDLGSELEYKKLWAETCVETLPLVIRRW